MRRYCEPYRLSPSARTIAGSCAKRVHIAGVRLVLSTHVPGPIAVRAVGARSCPERSIRPFTGTFQNSAARSRTTRVSRAMARKQKAAEEVRRIAWELHAKGIRLTRQHLRPLLTSSDYLNIDDGALSAAGGPAADNRAD